ncbi:ATP-binding protein [Cellulomonas hominis]|nr:ATP-binding protein [Cellulomonas hominis]MBB5473270.1 DNA replication protein DnaC [Cellulomonas hominis]NKY05867.1 ATP-binding protein [Cellulomonas hominis]NKY11903.1 ATP-binding protein [Cellulomonas hominis]
MTTQTSATGSDRVPRRRGLTEEATDAAIDQACRMMRLPTTRGVFEANADAAAREQMTYRGFLAELLLAECDDRARRRSERRIKAAAFPRIKTLREFDFDANPNVDPRTSNALAKCDWVRRGHPLCLIGDSGTGKSHLLIALGTEVAMAGFRVKYTLATKLANALAEAADEMVLTKTFSGPGRAGRPRSRPPRRRTPSRRWPAPLLVLR